MGNDKSGRLKHAPLVYVVAMVRFENQQIGTEQISNIRAELESDFPRFDSKEYDTASIQIGEVAQLQSRRVKEWHGESVDYNTGFMLRNDGLFVHTLNYKNYKAFSKIIEKVLSVVQKHLGFQHFQAIGIRYIDAIYKEGLSCIEDYVEKPLLGYRFDDAVYTGRQTVTESVGRNGEVAVRLRCARMPDHVSALPNDLGPLVQFLGGEQENKREPKGEDCLFLDTDCFLAEFKLRAFDKDDVLTSFDNAHRMASDMFKNAVTDPAWEEWG